MTPIQQAILDILGEGESWGWPIAEALKARGFWFAHPRVYPALRELEYAGVLTVERRFDGPAIRAIDGRVLPRWYYRRRSALR